MTDFGGSAGGYAHIEASQKWLAIWPSIGVREQCLACNGLDRKSCRVMPGSRILETASITVAYASRGAARARDSTFLAFDFMLKNFMLKELGRPIQP